MATTPGVGHSGSQPPPPERAHSTVVAATGAALLLLGCVPGTYFLTLFEANCSNEPEADKPCISSSDPAFSEYPIIIGLVACILFMILLGIPARFVAARRMVAGLVVLGPSISVLIACEAASGYGFVP